MTKNTESKDDQGFESPAVEDEQAMDLENFGKKKKKKKKAFNLDELEVALPDAKEEVISNFGTRLFLQYLYLLSLFIYRFIYIFNFYFLK